jgi:hypothetical protein
VLDLVYEHFKNGRNLAVCCLQLVHANREVLVVGDHLAQPHKSPHDRYVHLIPARFLDLRTLLWALRNRSYSLESACREFKTAHQKIDHRPAGRVTVEELENARNDVACTIDLLNAVKREFDLHPIAPGPDRMFSPASVAKSYLEELNILHPCEKVKDVFKAYGIFMQGYYSGRAECRIRNREVPVYLVDFMAQYPQQHTLEKICKQEPVRATKLAVCLKVLEACELQNCTPGG